MVHTEVLGPSLGCIEGLCEDNRIPCVRCNPDLDRVVPHLPLDISGSQQVFRERFR